MSSVLRKPEPFQTSIISIPYNTSHKQIKANAQVLVHTFKTPWAASWTKAICRFSASSKICTWLTGFRKPWDCWHCWHDQERNRCKDCVRLRDVWAWRRSVGTWAAKGSSHWALRAGEISIWCDWAKGKISWFFLFPFQPHQNNFELGEKPAYAATNRQAIVWNINISTATTQNSISFEISMVSFNQCDRVPGTLHSVSPGKDCDDLRRRKGRSSGMKTPWGM